MPPLREEAIKAHDVALRRKRGQGRQHLLILLHAVLQYLRLNHPGRAPGRQDRMTIIVRTDSCNASHT